MSSPAATASLLCTGPRDAPSGRNPRPTLPSGRPGLVDSYIADPRDWAPRNVSAKACIEEDDRSRGCEAGVGTEVVARSVGSWIVASWNGWSRLEGWLGLRTGGETLAGSGPNLYPDPSLAGLWCGTPDRPSPPAPGRR